MGLTGAQAEAQVNSKSGNVNLFEPLKLVFLSEREVCGRGGVAVKCIDIKQNSDCEGSIPTLN